ncbi:hypothetical protein GCM10010215_40060 [Streptomyces virginiae]|uniref:RNA polymerase sigma factor 70 region 4 type 2 domain-containing protein n=1 Tax=Streptomyces virginiae TaxID=1961 RepID=A0ABQ3NZJ6_STRVG|nr:sigma-70 region 4 domain-containing protein [Streptomyces virginiae]MBP2343809.1 DNA invertase Pin-like site-specific DNA recombinase [Streptomyces virginiae]GGQ11000.1 hypothetical protein GCM10010215_40060 [Streptomyces virginiae]GHI18201.1 hypothetical protein Scinn_76640 [Streptomyces virginiae]
MPQRKPSAHFAKQAQQAYELSLSGLSYRQIAEEMGVSLGTVQKRLALYIKDRVHPKADEYRARQIDSLHMYLRALRKPIESGDPKAIANAVRIQERIAKLLGLDSATAFKVEVENVDTATEFNKMLDKLMGQEGRTEREGNRPRRRTQPQVLQGIANTYDPTKDKPAPHNPETELAKDATFAAHEVQPEAVRIAEDLEEFEPKPARPEPLLNARDVQSAKKRRSRGASTKPNPLLRDYDD